MSDTNTETIATKPTETPTPVKKDFPVELGPLWKKEYIDAKSGQKKTILSGWITVDGERQDIVVRKNYFKKEGSNAADYRIFPFVKKNTPRVAPTKEEDSSSDSPAEEGLF